MTVIFIYRVLWSNLIYECDKIKNSGAKGEYLAFSS